MDRDDASTPAPEPLSPKSGHDSWPPLTADTERQDPSEKLPPAAVVTPRGKDPISAPAAADAGAKSTAAVADGAESELDDEVEDDGTIKVRPHERGKPGKPLTPFQRRINQAIARQREAELRAEDAERRLRETEARYRPEPPPPSAPGGSRDPMRAKPERAQFADDYEFIDALTDWKNDRTVHALLQTQAQVQQQHAQSAADVEFNARRDAWIRDHPDYPDVVAAATHIDVSPMMEQFFRHDPAGVAVIDYLARHPDEAQDLARLAPGPAFVRLGRLAQIVDTPSPNGHPGVVSNGRPPQPPRAPAPLTPVGAGQHRSTDPADLDFGPEYVRRGNEADRLRRRAGLR